MVSATARPTDVVLAPEAPSTGVTVIVPTLNRGAFLLNTLRDLVAQTHRPLEILIVDQSDTTAPEVATLVASHRDLIKHHQVSFRGLPQARNYGWQNATHEYLLYVDDDIRCGPTLVEQHLRVLRREGIGLVGGGIDVPRSSPDVAARPGAYDRWSATPSRGFGSETECLCDHAQGCNFSIRRDAIALVGGVDEAFSVGPALYEETGLALRVAKAGYRVAFNGLARVEHFGADTGGCRVDRVVDYVYGLAHNRAILIRRHSRPWQRPVAFAHLAATGVAFAVRYRRPGCLAACVRGAARGWRVAPHPPRSRIYRDSIGCSSAAITGRVAPSDCGPGAAPGVTVIVPTLNRQGFLRDTLRDLVAQTYRPLEILVVDQSAGESTVDDLVSPADRDTVTYHRVPFRGLPQARNYGWHHARYDHLLYVDDDIRCSPDLVASHMCVLTLPGVGMVGGGIDEINKAADLAGRTGSFSRWSASPTRGFGQAGTFPVAHVPGGNFSIRREAISAAGGVDEALASGAALYEETDLALRVGALGYRIMFSGSSRLQHLGASNGGCRVNDAAGYVAALAHNRAILIRRHSRPWHVPVAFAHLGATGVAFAWRYRSLSCVPGCLRGARAGWRAGRQRPRRTAAFPAGVVS